MAKKKWYVVTVGREIGVFDNWLETGGHINGVPDALQQSFPTREAADRAFADAVVRGKTRVVNPDAPRTPNQRRRHGALYSPAVGTPLVVPRNFYTASRTHRSEPTSVTARTRTSSARTHTSVPTSVMPASSSSSTITRSSSEPSPSALRLQVIQAALNESSSPVGVEAQVPTFKRLPSPLKANSRRSHGTRASTSTASGLSYKSHTPPRAPSPASSESSMNSIHITSHHYHRDGAPWQSDRPIHAICRTPSWLEDYPTAPPSPAPSGLLSPLNTDEIPLRSLHIQDERREPTTAKKRTPRSKTTSVESPKPLPVSATTSPISTSIAYTTPKSRTPKVLDPDFKVLTSISYDSPYSANCTPKDNKSCEMQSSPASNASNSSLARQRKVKSPSTSSGDRTPAQPSGTVSTIYLSSPVVVPAISRVQRRKDMESSPRRSKKSPSSSSSGSHSPNPSSGQISSIYLNGPLSTTPLSDVHEVFASPQRSVNSPASSSTSSNRTQSRTPQQSSGGFTSIYTSTSNPPVRPPVSRVVQHQEDPRSPILHQAQVPEITYLSFTRPSPQIGPQSLPFSPFPSSSNLAATSLLFKSNPSTPVRK
ncbi:hypothetical protein CPB83DRAFT_854185 [Crepidotus variabilis]|uniref:Ribonuclease H1 N-terminal domain-containing protein n=1 Tax=Crepidotus variabilis TaxID=179855 RepID=A0A9P6EF93_9AGAR|nr:hypothetical protein CPB83DRAFT_854185 [Crepidotus variabilis]